MQLTEMSAMGFRTSVTVFRRPAGGLRWVIIPAIHMGHADHYRAIWQRPRSCQAVIAEIWDGPSSTGVTYANAMRLARQRASRDLVRELTGRLGYRVMPGARWLTAIDYDEPPYLRKPPLDGWMDW